MKAYKVVLLVVDHDELGDEEITEVIEHTRYPNHCVSPTVMTIEGADIGEWTDDHPLNSYDTMKPEFERLFSSELFTDEEWAAFHDVVIETLPKDAPPSTPAALHAIFTSLPTHLKEKASNYGLNDTQFRDAAYEHLMKTKKSK